MEFSLSFYAILKSGAVCNISGRARYWHSKIVSSKRSFAARSRVAKSYDCMETDFKDWWASTN